MDREMGYVRRDEGISIAYYVGGSGPLDLLVFPGFVSHGEFMVEDPAVARFFERLGSFARVISFDKRGTGLSDRGVGAAPLEDHVADALAVLHEVGCERAAVFGVSEGGSSAALFAATHPARTSALVLWGAWPRVAWAPDFPIGIPAEQLERSRDYVVERWGTGVGLSAWAPSVGKDPAVREWWARFQRLAASPRDVAGIMSTYLTIDVRHVLPAISAPSLVLHAKGDLMVRVEAGRYLAEHIPGARLVELEGSDHFVWTENADAIVGEIQEFLTGVREQVPATRKLATLLFSDIVGSTERAAHLGDQRWRDLLGRHDAMTRRTLERFGGTEVKATGDGFLAAFDGPTTAIRCGAAIRDGALGLGLHVRVGIHTGEIEIIGDDVGGIGVHIARRVADGAAPDEVWASGTVPGLVVGSGVEFEDRGTHELKGVPGRWQLYAVA